MSVQFEVTFRPYHDIPHDYILWEGCTRSEARECVAELLKYNRKYGTAKIIESGIMYEISQPELNMLAYDSKGILEISSYDFYDDEELDFWDEYELLAS